MREFPVEENINISMITEIQIVQILKIYDTRST